MARIEKTFDDRAWFMIECDDPNCEQRFDDSQWYADEDDLLTDAKDEGCGVLEFKQGFNGHAEELVGAFILPTSTIRYKLSEAAHTIKLLKEAGR